MGAELRVQPLDGAAHVAALREDPLARVLELGTRTVRTGALIGIFFGLGLHGIGAAQALSIPIEVERWATAARLRVHDYLWTVYDVEVEKPKAPDTPPPPPQEDKQEEAAPAPRPIAHAPKAVEAAPAAAQAGKILTQETKPDEPVDLTGQGFVTGNADSYAGGVTAASGTSTTAVHDRNARADGVVGGKGTAPAAQAAAPSGPDRSRSASITPGTNWSGCPFPPEADADQIDFALVQIVVTVRPDGSAQSVKVVSDPGHGFGRQARLYALGQRFVPALDHDGNPVLSTTPPITVRFTR